MKFKILKSQHSKNCIDEICLFGNENSKLKIENFRGFSLVELLVVIAIIATISVSSVVGFARLKDVLVLREASTFILDLVKQEELKVLRGDFEKSTINFLPAYVVIEESLDGANLMLELVQCPTNQAGEYGVMLKNDGQLIQSGPNGVIQTRQLSMNTTDCLTDIANSENREIVYQLVSGEDFSNRIRFVHFNLNRDPVVNNIEISSGATTRIEISPPYGKKIIYNQQGLVKPSWNLILRDKNTESEETLTLR